MVPTTVATGLRAGIKVAATGRTRLAIGRAFFTAGRAFLVNQLFWSGAAEEKEGVVFISKRVILYYHIITFMLITPKYTR